MTNDSKEEEKEALKEHNLVAESTASYRNEFKDLDNGWAWAVLFASFGTFFLIGNSMYAVGIIHSALLERYEESVALTSWAGALHTALMSLGGKPSLLYTYK